MRRFSSAGKESAYNAGDPDLIPGLERSHGEGKGYPLQYSGRENSMDYIVHRVTRNRTWLSDFHLRRSKLNFDEEFQREERIVVGKNSVIQNLEDNN